MSRTRKVEPEAAVQAAQALFWKHGFEGLGTRQIEEETGLTRFTLQTSYGGKKALFLQTLDAYLDNLETSFLPDATVGDLRGLASWFEARSNPEVLAESACYGCLMQNSIVEFGGQDPDVDLRAERFFNMLRGCFRQTLASAKSNGVLSSEFDVDAKAEILVGLALGLNVVIRAATDNAAGQPLATATAAMIREWR